MKQLYTRWGKELKKRTDKEGAAGQVLPEYPRPLLEREGYVCLNGYWEYRITRKKNGRPPEIYDGRILVPFSPESALSGVKRQLKPGEELWYRRTLITGKEDGKRTLLHFGAVDQMCIVYVNGRRVRSHSGGYLPFTADITRYIEAGENELCVRVRDVSDRSCHAKGKQRLLRGGMFYTAQSGIWQTVWMETVPRHYIESLKCTPLYDESAVEVTALSHTDMEAEILFEGETYKTRTNRSIRIPVKERKSWTPETPYLYRYEVKAGEDRVKSYFAMRLATIEKDQKGIPRICLNHKPYFQNGVLDQGYWPDGLYTAPSDEAMIFDIMEMKKQGFVMLRKHCKTEPQRWYYHCDRLGMLVWQDMINGGSAYHHWFVTYAATAFGLLHIRISDKFRWLLSRKNEKGRLEFEKEMRGTVKALYNHPSVIVWTLFNEGWGQFDTVRLTRELRRIDRGRLIDAASGWFDQGCGDLKSEHNYFFRLKVKPEEKRAAVLSEFGGFSMRVKGHSSSMQMYGYRIFADKKKLNHAYRKLWEEVESLKEQGLCAAVYTQVSDIEEEVNGIFTYDREVRKIES